MEGWETELVACSLQDPELAASVPQLSTTLEVCAGVCTSSRRGIHTCSLLSGEEAAELSLENEVLLYQTGLASTDTWRAWNVTQRPTSTVPTSLRHAHPARVQMYESHATGLGKIP